MLVVSNIRHVCGSDFFDLQADVAAAPHIADKQTLWFRLPASLYDSSANIANGFLAACVLPAMKMHQPLHVEGVVSKRLLSNMRTFMDIASAWIPGLIKVEITAAGTEENVRGGKAVGCFFSGGVDSFYSLMKHEAGPREGKTGEVSHLIFVKGFDVPLSKESFADGVTAMVRDVCASCNKASVIASTNLRVMLDRFLPWEWAHGSALGSVALAMGPAFQSVLIPASYGYKELFPYGSHPLLDPLFSTESLCIVHDGCECTRLEKIGRMMSSRVVLDHLRVCYQDISDGYNCGKCEKCLRTKVGLALSGALQHCATFDHHIDHRIIRDLKLKKMMLPWWQENYQALRARNGDRKLAKAVETCLRRSARLSGRSDTRRSARRLLRRAFHRLAARLGLREQKRNGGGPDMGDAAIRF
jgi:hypothetical protein